MVSNNVEVELAPFNRRCHEHDPQHDMIVATIGLFMEGTLAKGLLERMGEAG
jgi:hypothetical protein